MYVVLQVLAARSMRGRARRIVLLPLPLMAVVAIATAKAYAEGSNLWPIWLILVSPLASMYLAGFWVIEKRRRRVESGPTEGSS